MIAAVILLAATASAQQACFDKIAVSGFAIEPEKLSADTVATFRAVITNNCSSPLNVPWEIRLESTAGPAPIAAGKTLVPASSSVTVTATSGEGVTMFDGSARLKQIADDGTCSFSFVADPYDEVRDSMKTNNSSPKISRYVTPAMRTIVLSADAALAFGAKVGGRSLAGSQCMAPKITMMGPAAPYSVRFSLDCSGGTMGGKASVEAFMTFLMKHGYRVKGIRRYVRKDGPDVCNNSQADEAAGRAALTFDAPPAAGTNNPYFKARLSAQGRRSIVACLALEVEGPYDLTDPNVRTPYHCDAPSNGWSCESGLRR